MGCIGGNTECGCLNGIVGMLDTAIKGEIGLVSKPMCGSIGMLDTSIKGRVGIICTPNTGIYIRFDKSLLSWLGADNKEGVTKYNVLIASDGWELKEVEELL